MTIIRANSVATFAVALEVGSIAIGVADELGRRADPPHHHVLELMMTLLEMMRRALRPQHDDHNLRLGDLHCHVANLRRISHLLRTDSSRSF